MQFGDRSLSPCAWPLSHAVKQASFRIETMASANLASGRIIAAERVCSLDRNNHPPGASHHRERRSPTATRGPSTSTTRIRKKRSTRLSWSDGQYDPAVLQKLNWFLRDWRREEATKMDPKLFDTIWEVYRESGSQQPIEVMSAYRSPETNAMLRRASRAVAEHSQHILGKAMDQHYVDVPMSRIREIAMRLQRGGVGLLPDRRHALRAHGRRRRAALAAHRATTSWLGCSPTARPFISRRTANRFRATRKRRAETRSARRQLQLSNSRRSQIQRILRHGLFGGSGDEEGDGPAERDSGSGRPAKGAQQRVASLDRQCRRYDPGRGRRPPPARMPVCAASHSRT